MSSKYHGLPDIDTAPDVFETSDEPGRILMPSEPAADDGPSKPIPEGLDLSGLPKRNEAQQRFGRSKQELTVTGQNFRLPPLRTHTLESDSESEDDRALESTAARLRRLKAELAEVEADIKAGPSKRTEPIPGGSKRRSVLPPRPPVDLAGELETLRERLSVVEGLDLDDEIGARTDDVQWRERLERLKLAEQSWERRQTNEAGDGDGGVRDEHPISDLDKRLARLESALGTDEMTTPLLPSLARSDHLLSLFTQPRHLDAISRRVKLLLVDLDRAATASRRNPQATPNLGSSPEKQPSTLSLSQVEYDQLQQVFNVLPRLDPLLPIVDPLLTRLKSLQTLHAEAGEMADGLKRLQHEKKDNTEDAAEMRKVVEEVQKGMSEAAEGIERNWKSLESRLSTLDSRIKALNT